jgi:hypothetical protein
LGHLLTNDPVSDQGYVLGVIEGVSRAYGVSPNTAVNVVNYPVPDQQPPCKALRG